MSNSALDAILAKQAVLDDERLIRRTLALYCTLLDDRRFDDGGMLFTQDADWITPKVRFKGRAEIVAGLAAIEPPAAGHVKHLSYPPVIEIHSATRARAWSDVVVLSRNREGVWKTAVVGRYYDDLEKEEGIWRFRRRQADIDTATQPLPDLAALPTP